MFNNSSNLYGSEWLAVVFSNRNKNYGAYELRQQSDNITMKALFIASFLFVLFFVGPVIYGKLNPSVIVLPDKTTIVTIAPDPIHEIKEQPEKKIEAAPEKPIVEQPKAKSRNFTSNIELVKEPMEEVPTADELTKVVIASVTQEGVEGKHNALETPPVTGTGGNGKASTGNSDEIIEVAGVEVYPEFPGGMAAWAKYIQRNLRYPPAAQDAGAQGKVYLSFVVEKDGSITDVKVLKGIGYGCDDEAKRVIQKSPKWNAGKQNNQTVRVRYNMPISYALQ